MGLETHKEFASELCAMTEVSIPFAQKRDKSKRKIEILTGKILNGCDTGKRKKYAQELERAINEFESALAEIKRLEKKRDEIFDKYGYYK